MADKVKYKYPEEEDDNEVHAIGHDIEFTLCGSAFEGHESKSLDQGFVYVKQKITCKKCIRIIEHCKTYRTNEIRKN